MSFDPKRRIQQAGAMAQKYFVGAFRRYQKLNLYGKAFVWLMIFFHIALVTVFVKFGADRIFQFLYDSAQKLKAMPSGWIILSAIIIITSLPPLVGGSTTLTVCGFAYGAKAFSFVAPAACIGAAFAFLTLRYFFREKVRRFTQRQEKWRALEAVIAAKGLPLIVLIRLAPLPWTYSNALFATIESVSFWQFMVATVLYTPKLFIIIFIGSRVAKFSDGQQRGEMDAASKWLNALSIALGVSIGFGATWLVWRLTDTEIRNMKELPQDVDNMAADALRDAEAGAPLLADYSEEDELDGDGALRLNDSSDSLTAR
ncbi:SNARE associated protein [Rhizoctonia solani AG-3 Rhs1AP]|uniref:Golgi apparatus membrane protein TVP38 n=2 Tax=Rhizoctonia solani AG-3 TaxID=1086053 RepID=A0A074S276_9AGAM|nr:SNARE associated protein [Rhizoctonia solani AG-3 Rhs1AP]KEP53466.1 SNARE associated protein [Rhizoctonia solani 123E]